MLRNRVYVLRCDANAAKKDTARYTHKRYIEYLNAWIGRLFFRPDAVSSTNGTGGLANYARNTAQGIVHAVYALQKSTGCKINVPVVKSIGCPAKLERSETKHFDYWLRVANQFTKKDGVHLPCKSHKAFNRALKNRWQISSAEFKIIKGVPYAIVYVTKDASKVVKPNTMIGVDVGVKYSVVSSEGHLGHGLHKVMQRQKKRNAERQRQGHKKLKQRTEVKQILDREAKILLRRSQQVGAGLAVESPKVLGNLRSGSLQGWARSYFANRVHTLGKEEGVLVLDINPAYTSQTCSKCGIVDKESRVSRDLFTCKVCGHSQHADVNAARNLALKGTQILNEKLLRFRRSE